MGTAPFIHVKRRFLVQDKIKLNSTKVNVTILVERFWGSCACTRTTLGQIWIVQE
jgi:hypothetical protein